MTSTTLSTRTWYSSERRLVISCRSPIASRASGISTITPKARSMRVRRLINHSSSTAVHNQQSPVPFLGYAGTPTAHNHLQPCVNQGNNSLRVHPSNVIEDDQLFPARVERTTVEHHDITGVIPTLPRHNERFPGQSGSDLIRPTRAIRVERVENCGCAGARSSDKADEALGQITRRAVVPVVYDATGRGRCLA